MGWEEVSVSPNSKSLGVESVVRRWSDLWEPTDSWLGFHLYHVSSSTRAPGVSLSPVQRPPSVPETEKVIRHPRTQVGTEGRTSTLPEWNLPTPSGEPKDGDGGEEHDHLRGRPSTLSPSGRMGS